MNRKNLWERLRREAGEYLTDLRNLRESLRSAEGWFTLGLVLAVIFMLVVWFITALGFDRLNMAIAALGQSHGRVCKPIGDFDAMIIVIDAVTMCLLAVLALGEMMRLLDRVRQHLPKEPRKVAMPAAVMLVVGTVGIIYMRIIC